MQGDLVTVVGRHVLTVNETVRGPIAHIRVGHGDDTNSSVIAVPVRFVNFPGPATPLDPPSQGEVADRHGVTRKAYYGTLDGKEQPWDTILRKGWGATFCGSNVLKYLRRVKNPDDLDKARWYWVELNKLSHAENPQERAWGTLVLTLLVQELTSEEVKRLVPISDFPDGSLDPTHLASQT